MCNNLLRHNPIEDLLSALENTLEELASLPKCPAAIIAGNFNSLPSDSFQ